MTDWYQLCVSVSVSVIVQLDSCLSVFSLCIVRCITCIIQGGSNMTGTNCDLFTHR
jgi:hypothetical protein